MMTALEEEVSDYIERTSRNGRKGTRARGSQRAGYNAEHQAVSVRWSANNALNWLGSVYT